jgi:hypothetical protein
MFILNSLTSLARHGVAIAVFAICLGIQFWILPLEQGLAFLTFYPGTALTALLIKQLLFCKFPESGFWLL